MNNEQRKQFFSLAGFQFGKCLEPMMECTQKAIRAHSIQNARVFDLLAVDGHLITPEKRIGNKGPEIKLQKSGRNKASTFTGLCGEHDASLFLALDSKPFDANDREQLFLLAYRSVTRELHAIMEGAARIQSGYSSMVERGVVPGNAPSEPGILATEFLMKSYETWQYRADYFDQPLLSRQFDKIEHDILILEGQKPCIAVSSLFSLDEVQRGDDIVRVVLNIFPVDSTRTVAVFSYSPEDRRGASNALDSIFSSNNEYQKYELSKLILSRMENFVISPAHFSTWSQNKTSFIENEFLITALGKEDARDHPDLMLF